MIHKTSKTGLSDSLSTVKHSDSLVHDIYRHSNTYDNRTPADNMGLANAEHGSG